MRMDVKETDRVEEQYKSDAHTEAMSSRGDGKVMVGAHAEARMKSSTGMFFRRRPSRMLLPLDARLVVVCPLALLPLRLRPLKLLDRVDVLKRDLSCTGASTK